MKTFNLPPGVTEDDVCPEETKTCESCGRQFAPNYNNQTDCGRCQAKEDAVDDL